MKRRLLAGALGITLSLAAVPIGDAADATTSVSRWRSAAAAAGWPSSAWPRLQCIIRRESGGNPRAMGDHSKAMGLMQIRWDVHQSWLKRAGFSRASLLNGLYNLKAARLLYKRSLYFSGNGWAPWRSASRPC